MSRAWTETEVKDILDLRANKKWSWGDIGTRYGVTSEAARTIARKYGGYGAQPTERFSVKAPEESPGDVLQKLPDSQLREMMSSRGYFVEKLTPDKSDLRYQIDPAMFDGEVARFGALSCTHLGSKHQQLTHLHSFYQYAESKGVRVIFHAGDMVDGIDVYRGQEYEIFQHGVDAQRDYAIKNYPRLKNGGKTYVISGNHDYSFMQKAGTDIVKQISLERDDIEYLGSYGAFPSVLGLNIYLQHGGGGKAYARSYKMQKNIEEMTPDKKPDIYLLGHYHSSCILLEYRNVVAFQLPSFQSQTPFARRHGWAADNGAFIITVTSNNRERENGISKVEFEFVPFYVPIDKDF